MAHYLFKHSSINCHDIGSNVYCYNNSLRTFLYKYPYHFPKIDLEVNLPDQSMYAFLISLIPDYPAKKSNLVTFTHSKRTLLWQPYLACNSSTNPSLCLGNVLLVGPTHCSASCRWGAGAVMVSFVLWIPGDPGEEVHKVSTVSRLCCPQCSRDREPRLVLLNKNPEQTLRSGTFMVGPEPNKNWKADTCTFSSDWDVR